ncbi:hypothetical protein [Priestia endophytica]|uniref:hypothetical protein n=1 Tax=Priestia endophytica TaxID=135735 RepID=UPI00203FD7A4|nr:hypothetical protein [Priestia endophytica]MCM3540772.1 hypothetical protein [Priestia endophytica]
MKVDMTAKEVMSQIQQLDENGESLRKKQVKQKHPILMKNALYFFPSWQHAVVESGISHVS